MEEDLIPELGFLIAETEKMAPDFHFDPPAEMSDVTEEHDVTVTAAVLSGLKGLFHLLPGNPGPLEKGTMGGSFEPLGDGVAAFGCHEYNFPLKK